VITTAQISTAERRDATLAFSIVFGFGALIAIGLTINGTYLLIHTLTNGRGANSVLSALCLGMLLAFPGPMILVCLSAILPRWWFQTVKRGFSNFFTA
jgi:hypothetical protein